MSFWFYILGLFIEAVTFIVIERVRTTYGTLRIDHSDPEKDTYRLELGDLDELSKKKYVRLKIDNNADLTHK